jgi:hypothetical protein
MSDVVWYVYGFVRAATVVTHAPAGIDGVAVDIEIEGSLGALVSGLPADAYSASAIEQSTADVEWLGPRAIAHDRVLSWASDHGAVIPLPMFTIFSSVHAVRAALRERAETLDATLRRVQGGREYALRVYRADAELRQHAAAFSPRLGEMEESARSASPGQRYLLERKLEVERTNELRVIGQRVAKSVYDALTAHALEAVRSPIPQVSSEATDGVMVLNAAFLVPRDAVLAFQERLTELVAEHGARGFRFDFTGPWPPYHFAQDSAGVT